MSLPQFLRQLNRHNAKSADVLENNMAKLLTKFLWLILVDIGILMFNFEISDKLFSNVKIASENRNFNFSLIFSTPGHQELHAAINKDTEWIDLKLIRRFIKNIFVEHRIHKKKTHMPVQCV